MTKNRFTILLEDVAIATAIKWSVDFANSFPFECHISEKNEKIDTQTRILLTDPANYNRLHKENNEPGCTVLLLTNGKDASLVTEALYHGIDAIADITAGPTLLLEKLKNLLANKPDETQLLLKQIIAERQEGNASIYLADEYRLTQKEKEILKLMREGNHLKLIASMTHTSYATVRTHVKNIYKKIEVNSASEAVIKAMNMQL